MPSANTRRRFHTFNSFGNLRSRRQSLGSVVLMCMNTEEYEAREDDETRRLKLELQYEANTYLWPVLFYGKDFGYLKDQDWSQWTISSGFKQVSLIELYSSEGCGSCPPAEEWFTSLIDNYDLWRTFVPVQFHVSYWDSKGWVDRFATFEGTKRHLKYIKSSWKSPMIYTPSFAVNGVDHGAMIGQDATASQFENYSSAESIGNLTVTRKGWDKFDVVFLPKVQGRMWNVTGVILANGVSSGGITSGENEGRTLLHDFLVVTMTKENLRAAGVASDVLQASVEFKLKDLRIHKGVFKPESWSVAFWVCRHNKEDTPLQAVGGDIEF